MNKWSNTDYSSLGDSYNYNFNNNRLTFSNEFNRDNYQNSTAVSACYKTLSIANYNGNTIISTNNRAECFDAYPSLSSLTINIIVDKKVTSNNADKVNGNTYTWNINRNNKNKGINLTFADKDNDKTTEEEAVEKNIVIKKDYTMYIFAGILLVIVLIIYLIIANP